MTNHTSEIRDLLQQALVIAWVIDNFKRAKINMQVECTNGQTLIFDESIEDLLPDTLQTGSNSIQTPPPHKSLADSLGDIKKNYWF